MVLDSADFTKQLSLLAWAKPWDGSELNFCKQRLKYVDFSPLETLKKAENKIQ